MQDQPIPADQSERVESAIYCMLTVHDEQRPWSVHELELETGDPLAVADSLAHLRGAGLIHRCGDFVWATRAALHSEAISL